MENNSNNNGGGAGLGLMPPRRHLINGTDIDKVLKSQNMSDAEKYSLLRIKTD